MSLPGPSCHCPAPLVIARLDRAIHASQRQFTDLTTPHRKLDQCGLGFDQDAGAAAVVGVGFEPLGFGLQGVLADEAGPPDAAFVVPAVAALLERVFGLERGAGGADLVAGGAGALQQVLQAAVAGLERRGQHLQQGVAVHQGAVGVVKPAAFVGQEFELGRAAALPFPVDTGKGAVPGAGGEHGQAGFDKGTVEPGVVRDDEVGGLHEFGHADVVDALATHHAVVDAGDLGDGGRDGLARVFEGFVGGHGADGLAGGGVDQHAEHGQLDDAFVFGVQPGGFGVEHDDALRAAGRRSAPIVARHQAAQDFVVGVRVERLGHGVVRERFGGGRQHARLGGFGLGGSFGRRGQRVMRRGVKAEAHLIGGHAAFRNMSMCMQV